MCKATSVAATRSSGQHHEQSRNNHSNQEQNDNKVHLSASAAKKLCDDGSASASSSSNDDGSGSNRSSIIGNNPFTLVLCTVGISASYLCYGMIQEQLVHPNSPETERIGATFVLATQTITNTFISLLWNQISNIFFSAANSHDNSNKRNATNSNNKNTNTPGGQKLHHKLLLLTAMSYFMAMTATNESLKYVSYPTAVLAKSCKLIPTMVMGLLVEKRSYQQSEWIGALCITLGIVIFNMSRLSEKKGSASNDDNDDSDSFYGIALLTLSLCMDGILSSCQGLLKKPSSCYRIPTAIESMFYINFYATFFLIPLSIYMGQFQHGMNLLLVSPPPSPDQSSSMISIRNSMILLNVTSSMGQIFIFITLTIFTPLITTTITTTRKFLTILLSIVKFNHVFTKTQWLCIFLVFTGLYMGLVSKFTSTALTTNNANNDKEEVSTQRDENEKEKKKK